MRDFRDSLPFPRASEQFLADTQMRANLRKATATIREKRSNLVAEKKDFEELRTSAAAIKDGALGRLDALLEELEANVVAAGGQVHFARDADEANRVVVGIVTRHRASEVVKVKSMTTAEIRLNEALVRAGIDVVETDLAELIVQLGEDLPSHIVVPAIHRNRAEIRRIFEEKMPREITGDGFPSDDPAALAAAARTHLRSRFLRARVAVSGANFAIAESGSMVVVESEGNGRMCLTLPEVLISVVGIDKVIPRFADLEVFLQLLACSATGERMSPYTSMWRGVSSRDGPSEFHLVLLDNGRSATLRDPVGRQALRCIRCAACLNVCPVYERVGGHAYGSVYPGPIGAVLTPQLQQVSTDPVAEALPFASTLCGACAEVCPVRIDIPRLLVHLRFKTIERRESRGLGAERAAMTAAAAVLSSPRRFEALERVSGWVGGFVFPSGRTRARLGPLRRWTDARDAPVPPRQPFRAWWRSAHGNGGAALGELARSPADARSARRSRRAAPRAAQLLGSAMLWWSDRRRQGASGEHRASYDDEPSEEGGVVSAVRLALRDSPMAPAAVPRSYAGAGGWGSEHATEPSEHAIEPSDHAIELFVERFCSYGGEVSRATPGTVAAAVGAVLEKRSSRWIVVPEDLPEPWLPTKGDFRVERDDRVGPALDLDARDAAVVACALAIAETGTVVLDGGVGQGRRALSLLPDHLVVVVEAHQVVAGLPDAMRRLRPESNQTWISGPSATVDIELVRVQGVHGPRKLDVVLVDA